MSVDLNETSEKVWRSWCKYKHRSIDAHDDPCLSYSSSDLLIAKSAFGTKVKFLNFPPKSCCSQF